jgi:predicted component of type VI protein secretion system
MKLTLSLQSAAPSAGHVAPLVVDRQTIRIGRGADCELVLPDALNRISRLHCRIDWDGSDYVLTDSSSLGTLVNGNRVNGIQRLAQGDIVSVGDHQIRVSLSSVPDVAPGKLNLDDWGRGAPAASIPSPSAASTATTNFPNSTPAATSSDPVTQLLAAAGIPRASIAMSDADICAATGALLQQLVGGLATALAARAKARKELGVDGADNVSPPVTAQASGAFAADLIRSGPAGAAQKARSAFGLIDAHQRATLYAMQGALARSLDALAPNAIRQRTKGSDAALWKAYEAAFAGSGDQRGFIDAFAQELGAEYEKLVARPPSG